jgi:hypothetical protein
LLFCWKSSGKIPQKNRLYNFTPAGIRFISLGFGWNSVELNPVKTKLDPVKIEFRPILLVEVLLNFAWNYAGIRDEFYTIFDWNF